MRKYETYLNNMIILRAKEELIKTELFGSQKYDACNFAMHRKFRYIAKFRYHSKNFAIIAKFLFHSEISLYSEISTYSENFAMHRKFFYIAKFRYHSEILLS